MKKIFSLLLCLGFVRALFCDGFDIAMGSETAHWAHVKQPQDLEDLALFRELFNRNIAHVNETHSSVKIPKVVHFIWLGPSPFPSTSVSNVRSWIAKNPDWTFKFWSDRPRIAPCHGMETIVLRDYPYPFLGRCYAASNNWGEKSDILRFEILFQEGGVYVDHDASCLVPFEPYHRAYRFYCGLETPHPPFAGRNITAGNGVIGSAPGHPVVQKVIELIEQRWDALAEKYPDNDGFSKTQIVMERTYMALTDALRLSLDPARPDDIVFPATYFFPKKGLKPVLSKHTFSNSWAATSKRNPFEKEMEQVIAKIDKRTDRLGMALLIAFIINLALMATAYILKKQRTV